jgi:predicted nucleotidyltransferase
MASVSEGCDDPGVSVTTQEEIEAIRRAVEVAAPTPDVAAIYLFGSRARGDAGPESDLDLGVVLARRRPPGTRATPSERATLDALGDRLALRTGEVTGVSRIDVVDLRGQGPLFAREALDGGILLFEGDRDARIDFVAETLVRAIDFEPTFEIAMQDREARMRAALRRDGLLPGTR